MTRKLKLPQCFPDVATGYPLIEPGTYTLSIIKMVSEEGQKVSVEYQTQNDEPSANHRIFQTYDLDTEIGLRLFKELTEAADLHVSGLELNLEECQGKRIQATIRNREVDGKCYNNVTRHRSLNDQVKAGH